MPTRKPTGALPGRPPLIGGKRLKNCVITMPSEMSEFAEALGNGNRSEGVRRALRVLMQKDLERGSAQD